MPQSPPDTHVGRCKSCGQPALLPETLELMVVCPRCGTEAKAAELLLLSTPESTSTERSRDPEFVNAPTILAMRSPSTESSTALPEGTTQAAGRFFRVLDGANRYLGGRRLVVLAAGIACCGIPLPILDHYYPSALPRYTILFGNLVLLWLWLLLFSWTLSLRDGSGNWCASKLGSWPKRALEGVSEALSEWPSSPASLRLRMGASALLWIGLLLVAAHGTTTLLKLVFEPSLRQTSELPLFPWWLGSLCVAVGTVTWLWGALKTPKIARTGTRVSKAASDSDDLPVILDLRESSTHDYGAETVRLTTVSALANWNQRKRRHYGSRDAYLAALVRHLRRGIPGLSIKREVWLGRSRDAGVADLVLGNQVLVFLQKGFGPAAADSSLSAMRRYQLARPTTPKLLVVFDAEKNLFEGPMRCSLEQLHQHANTVTVRV